MTTTPKVTTAPEVTTKINYNYTVSCIDSKNNALVFRDMLGSDLEFFDSVVIRKDNLLSLNSGKIIEVLQRLLVSPTIRIESLTPRAIRAVFLSVSENIIKNYMPKEDWLRQCYSIQNGSFQNIAQMEEVPMSKFTAMCVIHKEAMELMNNDKPAEQI